MLFADIVDIISFHSADIHLGCTLDDIAVRTSRISCAVSCCAVPSSNTSLLSRTSISSEINSRSNKTYPLHLEPHVRVIRCLYLEESPNLVQMVYQLIDQHEKFQIFLDLWIYKNKLILIQKCTNSASSR